MIALPHLRQLYFSALLIAVSVAARPINCVAESRAELIALVSTALSTDLEAAQSALTRLRAAGPIGLDAMFIAERETIEGMRSKPPAQRSAREQQLTAAIEFISQQRDVEYSQLYWYTDLRLARIEAQRLKRPILSLRMLGKLTEELSCANSRYFRSSLYSNPAIAALLRTRFVLHWSAERAVPKVRIDFGDGRILNTTVTGNSIHYLLDAKGRAFDGIPGLYTPYLFKQVLEQALPELTAAGSDLTERAFLARRAEFHRYAAEKRAMEIEKPQRGRPRLNGSDATAPPAFALAKTLGEAPILARIAAPGGSFTPTVRSRQEWEELARRMAFSSNFEPAALELINRKMAMPAALATLKASAKPFLVKGYLESAAVDAVRNEYSTHLALHRHLLQSRSSSPEALNEFVYAKLFLMPRGDRWLGLFTEETYNAIEGYGVEGNQARATYSSDSR